MITAVRQPRHGVATAAASRGFVCTIYLPEVPLRQRLRRSAASAQRSCSWRAPIPAVPRWRRDGLPRSEASPTSPCTTTQDHCRAGNDRERNSRGRRSPRCCGGVGRRWRTHLRYRDMDQGVLPSTLVIGASAANDRAMAASIDAGEIITPHFEPTFLMARPRPRGRHGHVRHCRAPSMAGRHQRTRDRSGGCLDGRRHHHLVEGAAGVALVQPHTSPIRTPVLGLSPSAVVPTSVQRRSRRCWRWPTARPTSTRSSRRPRRTRRSRPCSATPNPGRSGGPRRFGHERRKGRERPGCPPRHR